MANDGCIYWLPDYFGERILKFDPVTKHMSLVGNSLGGINFTRFNTCWKSGASASNGAIYCIPFVADQVLCIDPLKEFTTHLKEDLEQHPEKLGLALFESSCAIRKFGAARAFHAFVNTLEECVHDNQVFEKTNLYPFMIAASLENSALSDTNYSVQILLTFQY